MNILVTGGRGQLGCSLQKMAVNYPQFNLILTDMPEADITDSEGIRRLIESNEIGGIINCAAYTAVDKAETEADLADRINRKGPETLAALCAEYEIPLVQVSTDYVFNGKSYIPFRETDPTGSPLGVYGVTKRNGEIAVEKSGCAAAIVRTAWLYSEFGNNFVKTMLRLSETRPEIGVICDQIGSPTYAPDLADALLRLLDQGVTGCEIYHYTNEGVCSWYELAHEVFACKGVSGKLNALETSEYPTAAERPPYSVLNKSKIKSKGIEIRHWRDALEACIAEL